MVRLIFILLLSVMGFAVQAQQHIDVYRVDALVADQSEAERTAAAKATLGDVIVKLTGDSASLQHPLVRQAISSAPDYLLQFSYSSDRDSNAKENIKLTLNYSPQAIESLLRQAQLVSAVPQTSQVVKIRISNVQNFTAFKQVQAYLKATAIIRHSDLLSVNKDTLLFNLSFDGDIASLKTTLTSVNKLQLDESSVVDTQPQSAQLVFRWNSEE